ncbi:MAG TPA: hypothetical protein VKK31_29105 [Thermoanaerobaculia bacterium]|nr:hypothetical protein [Thermoanaerobaculia bacterium]
MKPVSRGVWIELTSLGLFLIALLCFLLAGIGMANFIVHEMLPNEPPIKAHGMEVGWKEILVGVLSMIVPGATFVMAAWSLRTLLVGEYGAEE